MKVCHRRLQKEYISLKKQPVDNIEAVPNDRNILEWHYVVIGPSDTVYAGGVYHGKLLFSEEYPYKPPSIFMITRSGRFKTNTRLCLSMSDFHPETWNPLWSVGSILSGLLSFMLDTTPTLGSIETSDKVKRELANRSMDENIKNEQFCKFFPSYVEDHKKRKRALKKGKVVSSQPKKANFENPEGIAGSASEESPGDQESVVSNKKDKSTEDENPQENERRLSCKTVILATIVLIIAVLLPLYLG
mmetsp:Transcript_2630/g.2977  ORF Transcript_2630/g.2977 Transcript_2630/m.2977 type:complete len:246 (-) Transcript_2630:1634-2371(-)